MSLQVIEVDPSQVASVPPSADDRDGFIYEHLKRYCEKFRPLPAITVTVSEGRLTAVRGYKYLSIARELGVNRIRAVLIDVSYDLANACAVPGILGVVPPELLSYDENLEFVVGWHVWFFNSTPSLGVAQKIEDRFVSFLKESLPIVVGNDVQLSIKSHFDLSGPCLEIEFLTPVVNRAWMTHFRALMTSVSRELMSISSYQGRRFVDQ